MDDLSKRESATASAQGNIGGMRASGEQPSMRDACLGPIIASLVIVGVLGALWWRSSNAQHSSSVPPTTLADDAARVGCFSWWEADDPSVLTTEEAEARRAEALDRAATSSVVRVAVAARTAQAALEADSSLDDFSAAMKGFETACEAVGQGRYP